MSEQTDTEHYIVQENESLSSIATKLDITLLNIKTLNPNVKVAIPGMILNVKPIKELPHLHPIDSQIFSRAPLIDGDLYLDETQIRFQPRGKREKPILIDLIGYVDATITPHPCDFYDDVDEVLPDDFLALLHVNYLSIPSDPTSMEIIEFAGLHEELRDFKTVLQQRSTAIQVKSHYNRPLMSTYIKPVEETKRRVSDFCLEFEGLPDPSKIMTPTEMGQLNNSLPKRLRKLEWHLVYRLSDDGSSYNEFMTKTRGLDQCVLVMKTDGDSIIGCYSSAGFDPKKAYAANGETYVFSFFPSFVAYRWSKTVNYFVNVDKTNLSIGGGGSAAIWLDDRMLHGFSEKCDAFNNPPLASDVDIKCMNLEVWHISYK